MEPVAAVPAMGVALEEHPRVLGQTEQMALGVAVVGAVVMPRFGRAEMAVLGLSSFATDWQHDVRRRDRGWDGDAGHRR